MEIWKKMWVGVFFWTQCSVIHCHTTDYSLLLIYYTVYNKVIQHCSLPLSYSIKNNDARFGLARNFFDANNNVFKAYIQTSLDLHQPNSINPTARTRTLRNQSKSDSSYISRSRMGLFYCRREIWLRFTCPLLMLLCFWAHFLISSAFFNFFFILLHRITYCTGLTQVSTKYEQTDRRIGSRAC